MPDEFLTVNEVAALLKLNQQTIRNMIDRGDLGAVRVGARRVRIRQSQLDAFLAAGESGPEFRQSDPWQAVSEAADRVTAAVRAHDRAGLDRARAWRTSPRRSRRKKTRATRGGSTRTDRPRGRRLNVCDELLDAIVVPRRVQTRPPFYPRGSARCHGLTRNLRLVPHPEPMLSVSARRWPDGGRWVLQPKWGGFRLLIGVGSGGEVRGWSRHGTDLTARLGSLLAPFADVAPGTTFDGELVALSARDGKPAQDFAAVTRAVFTGKPAATDRLRFVAFDVLASAGEDVRPRPWEERDARLRETLRVGDRIRLVESPPATPMAHEAIVALGFEGTVLKRPGSIYRAGRHRAWIKHKVRLVAAAELRTVHQDRDGRWHALCELDGGGVHALAGARTSERVGQLVELVYSRVDADGSLREARVAPAR